MDLGMIAGLDSESILPEFPHIHPQISQNNHSNLEMKPEDLSRIPTVDDTALDVEIKVEVEVSELFVGKSIDEENNQTVFPTGLILIHDQPTVTVTDSRTETHLLTYTPVYMTDNGCPSYLQMSAPNTSIIRTQNSEIQPAVQQRPLRDTRFCPRLLRSRNLTLKDPLEISPPKESNAVQRNSASATINSTPQDPVDITPRGRKTSSSESILRVEPITLTLTSSTGSNVKGPVTETREERRRRLHAEYARRVRERKKQSETPEQRTARQAVQVERYRKRLANETPEQRKARLAANAERHRKYFSIRTPEQGNVRLEVESYEIDELNKITFIPIQSTTERQKKYLVGETLEERRKRLEANAKRNRERFANETPEQRIKRLAANVQRNRERLVNETPEQRAKRLAGDARRHCKKSLASKKSLRGHMIREHSKTEDKKFECDHCEKTFAIQRECKTHVLTHSKEKRFICEKCGKSFKDKKGLTNHIIFKHRFDPDVQEKYWKA